MKKILALIALIGMASLAQDIAPIWDIKLNEGDFNAITSTGTKQFKLKVQAQENMEWVEGRLGGKALCFKNDPSCKKQPLATLIVPQTEHIDFSKPFTAMCWVKVDPASKGNLQYTVFGNVPSDYGPGFRIAYGWGAIRVMAGQGVPKGGFMMEIKNSRFPFEKGCWQHVALSYDGTFIRLYNNGIEGAVAEQKIYPTKPRQFYFASYNAYAYGFCGAISDFKLFDKTLTPQQIMKIAKDMQ